MAKATQASIQLSEADAKVAGFSYEEARSRLVDIVSTLEQGSLPLEDMLAHWELGEALARRCQSLLDGARERLDARTNGTSDTADLEEGGE
ncbi:MAG: exodeoxyribonuclease VII small subunit, partial [Actinomycetaceae bacterium]|nr:exodeoxyribonuclease VII small subunit [Actinomycetaceae bacterium]